MAKFVGIALLALTIVSMALAKTDVDGITEKLAQTKMDSKPKGDAGKEPAADEATKKGKAQKAGTKPAAATNEPAAHKTTKKEKAPKATTSPAAATNEPAAANEWNDELMGMSVEKFNEELAVLLPKANTFMENALSFINEQMQKNGIATGAAGGSCSAGIPAN